MKFRLDMAKNFEDNDKEKERLESLGFKAVPSRFRAWYFRKNERIKIEINSLDELMDFIKEWGTIVLDKDTLTIYNDYLE